MVKGNPRRVQFRWRRMLAAESLEASVDRNVGTGDERGFVGTKIEDKSRNLLWLPHSANRLRFFELLKHLFFSAWISAAKVAIDKRRVYSRRRNAIATYVVCEVILSHGIGHGYYGALAHGVCETIGETRRSSNGCHVQDDASTVGHHLRDRRAHAVVHSFHIH